MAHATASAPGSSSRPGTLPAPRSPPRAHCRPAQRPTQSHAPTNLYIGLPGTVYHLLGLYGGLLLILASAFGR
ncbi:MAG: hypothetical protein ABI598_00755, partial [Chloroflexota bacterium]